MQEIDTFVPYLEKVRQRTLRVAAVIPPEAFETSPAGKGFTFGDILRHLAGVERWMFAENVAGRPSRYPGHGIELASGPEETLAYAAKLHEDAVAIIRGIGDEGMLARCVTPGGSTLPAWKWLRSMVEHEAHHRGQIYTYLSILGVPTPPLYGLTAEQVLAASRDAGGGGSP